MSSTPAATQFRNGPQVGAHARQQGEHHGGHEDVAERVGHLGRDGERRESGRC
jgi:hypothetical protein